MLNNLINWLISHTPLFYWTQSLWRDEAFSVWIAQDGVKEVIARTAHDFNPPLYYLILHFWMKLFGRSEIILRGLSLIFFLFLLIFIYKFSLKIFRNKNQALITLLLAAFNPMLIYYAFELRMYSLFAFFATASVYFLFTKNWFWYVVFTTLGLYTQPFMAIFAVSQIPYFYITKQVKPMVKNFILLGLLYLPWLPTLLAQFKQSGPMWMFPVDINLFNSVLGNLYTGYEGTPGGLWIIMSAISLGLILISISIFKTNQYKPVSRLILSWVFLPLALVLGISLFKPIYVNRYLIFITVGQILLVSLWFATLKTNKYRHIIIASVLIITFILNFLASDFHRKVNIRITFEQITPLLQNNDLIYAQTPLVFFESLYYSKSPAVVRLYNPYGITPPKYVGSDGMPQSVWESTYPKFPKRAFVISEDGEYKIVSTL